VPHFNWVPLIIGLAFALGGLGLGFLVYTVWMPITRADEADPLERGMRKLYLGWLYDAFRERLYFDEVYNATLVRGSVLLANLSYAFDHRVVDGVINLVGAAGRGLSEVAYWFDAQVVDYLVNLVGRAGRALSNVSDLFDQQVVDGAVNGVGDGVRWLGGVFRPIQTGKVQNYLLLASLMVLVLVATAFLFVTF
jgi:NADH-quinone oxidoreductase subunit L